MTLHANRLRNYLFTVTSLLLMQFSAICAQGQTPVTTCGTMISNPGHYVLANDLLNCTADGVDINASNVELDLAGHQISGGASGVGIEIFASHVRILGPGTINSFSVGVLANFGSRNVDVAGVTSNGGAVGFIARFAEVTWSGNTASGNENGFELLPADNCELRGNRATGNSQAGFIISGNNDRIHMNVALNNGITGISVSGAQIDVVSNVALGNTMFDLADSDPSCGNNHWVHNTFHTANETCIH
jgi:parallel beta-helix repeat protein